MTEADPENTTQREVREEAAETEPDPVTKRESVEQDLMAEDESKAGEDLGDQMP